MSKPPGPDEFGKGLAALPALHPPLENVDLGFRPSTLAGHRPDAQAFTDALGLALTAS
jgi:hypothetical protein